jgi:hypothetical protein
MLLRISSLTIILLVVLIAFACNSKHDDKEGHSGPAEWKEMDNFHMVMAEAFHPYKDSSNLEAAKVKAPELAAAAKDWKNSQVPDGVDAEKMKSKLDQLTSLSEEFVTQVKTENDQVIGEKLTVLHDIFHELQNDFYAGAGQGHEHEHHDH